MREYILAYNNAFKLGFVAKWMLVEYHSKSGADYSSNSDGWKRNDENLKDACYVSVDVARKALEIYKNSRHKFIAEKILEQCKKINCTKSRGSIVYQEINGNLKFSSEIVSRQPNFSLEDNVLNWLEEVEPEDVKRDKQTEQEDKDEEKDDSSVGTIGFLKDA